MTKTNHNEAHSPFQQPLAGRVVYHPGIDEAYDGWAADCGWEPEALRRASEHAIINRHHESTIEHESHRAHGNTPDVFTLSLGSVQVYYSVEDSGVMVRGYGWEIDREPLDDFDGGGFYSG